MPVLVAVMPSRQALVLFDEKGLRYLVPVGESMARVPSLGVLEVDRLRANLGRKVRVGDRVILVLPASRRDRMEGLERRAQTVGPKDAASILFNTDVGPGDTVVEGGSGSGWLTVAIASTVGPGGRVITYEKRHDFSAFARDNLRRAGHLEQVEVRIGDIGQGIPEREIDAVVLDIPDPWRAVRPAWDALRIGGAWASFSPNVEQVRQTVESLLSKPFVDVRTLELIEREIEVRETGTKPSFSPLGHTGYLTFARKALESFL